MKPSTEAIAYRIWAHCGPLEWNTDVTEIAAALEENPKRIGSVLGLKGWSDRLRCPAREVKREVYNTRRRAPDWDALT